ncbi:hypothetical protein KDX22_25450 [Burkholderia cenocepacia]|uniref:hypothetical protein n=1 Tax=Burkholderia cenocepacia TaxID=95486 RepID=UPI001B941AB6|nr:hypothetical protein [Burkholderia cenocepacia]MBR7982566.1 hypothetical protein [Burkholderia cenocepacia]
MIVVLVVVNGRRTTDRLAAAHDFNLRAVPRRCCKDLLRPARFRNQLFRTGLAGTPHAHQAHGTRKKARSKAGFVHRDASRCGSPRAY